MPRHKKKSIHEEFSKSEEYINPESTIELYEVNKWAQGLCKLVNRQKNEESAELNPDGIYADEMYDWDWVLKTISDLILSNSDMKHEILNYIVEVQPGIAILTTCFHDRCFMHLYLKIFIILRECVNPRNKKIQSAALKQSLEGPYIKSCIKILVIVGEKLSDCKDSGSKNKKQSTTNSSFILRETIVNVLWYLSAMCHKDAKFSSTIRELGKIRFLFKVMKNIFFSRFSAYYPILKILRKLSKNSAVSEVLTKCRVMYVIKNMFGIFNNQPSPKFQMVLDIIVHLTKERSNCRQFLHAGCLIAVIHTFQVWTSWKGKGLLRMSKSILAIYSHIASIPPGRKALLQSSALSHVKRFCESCPVGKGFDDIMMRACGLLKLCYNVHKLPIMDLMSPARYDIPKLENQQNDEDESGTSSDEDNPDEPDLGESDDDIDDLTDGDTTGLECEESYSRSDTTLTSAGKSRNGRHKRINTYIAELKRRDLQSRNSLSATISDCFNNNNKKESVKSIKSQENSNTVLMEYAKFFIEFDVLKNRKSLLQKNSSFEPFNIRSDISLPKNSYPKSAKSSKHIGDGFHLEKLETKKELRKAYQQIANRIRSVIPFVKLAYPDMTGAGSALKEESLLPSADRSTLRNKVLTVMSRVSGCDPFKSKVVYDLDVLTNESIPKVVVRPKTTGKLNRRKLKSAVNTSIRNNDEKEVGNYDRKLPVKFESRFESGNLRKAIQIGTREFNLVLMPDVNSMGHSQWFYFQISNVLEDVVYTFNIINCLKGNSQFNFGMQPVVFSVAEAAEGNSGWVRSGFNICYFRNGYKNTSGRKKNAYYTASFSLTFRHRGDIVYVAYHIPYTYTRLLVDLEKNFKRVSIFDRIIRYDILCQTLNQNDVPVITVTGPSSKKNPLKDREVIFLTARVHPGETNASWVMQGILNKLILDSRIDNLLKKFVFKVVPMLNVEGVINGCHRCGLTGEDLNRRWKNPNKIIHPTIYNAKMLIEYSCNVQNKVPALFCDLHGHSRRKNVFVYGCSKAQSWSSDDRNTNESLEMVLELPVAISKKAPAFSLNSCNYDVRKNRETTARVTVWRDFNIVRSYTLECSYCGCDRGDYKGLCIGTKHLLEVGEALCTAVESLCIH